MKISPRGRKRQPEALPRKLKMPRRSQSLPYAEGIRICELESTWVCPEHPAGSWPGLVKGIAVDGVGRQIPTAYKSKHRVRSTNYKCLNVWDSAFFYLDISFLSFEILSVRLPRLDRSGLAMTRRRALALAQKTKRSHTWYFLLIDLRTNPNYTSLTM